MKLLLQLAAACLLISACNMFAPPASQQTLQAERDARGTEVASARETATLQFDRLSLTIEAAGTSVSRAAAQTTRIAATLIALGTPFVDARFITPELLPTPASGSVNSSSGASANVPPIVPVQPTIVGQGGAQGNSSLENAPAPTLEAEIVTDPNASSLTNLVITDRVGADDCAIGSMSTFTPQSTSVYIVAQANNLPANSRLAARWYRDGIEQISYEWTPGFPIQSGCIWFNMPSSDVEFTAGSWSVQLELDGQPVGTPVPFNVTDM